MAKEEDEISNLITDTAEREQLAIENIQDGKTVNQVKVEKKEPELEI